MTDMQNQNVKDAVKIAISKMSKESIDQLRVGSYLAVRESTLSQGLAA